MGITHFENLSFKTKFYKGAYGSEVEISPLFIKELSFSQNTSETDTGWDLPANAIVEDVWVKVDTAVSGATLNVGLLSTETGGDADGFIKAISCSSTGLKIPGVTVTKTTGTNENYISAVTNTLGALLLDLVYETGTDTAGDTGFVHAWKKPHVAASVTAKSVSYSTSNHAIAGKIYILYREI